jgi:hypothetical protein
MKLFQLIISRVRAFRERKKKVRYFKEFEKQLKIKYSQSAPESTIDKCIIIMLDKHFDGGGLVDKLKGIVTAKYIADYLMIPFFIYNEEERVPIHNFLKPLTSNYLFDPESLNFSSYAEPVVFINYAPTNKKDILKRFTEKKQYHFYCNLDLIGYFENASSANLASVWSAYFNSLFLFDSLIQAKWSESDLNSKKCISVHFRFTSLLGDFKDVWDRQVTTSEQEEIIKLCINGLTQLTQSYDGDYHFLIFSDSVKFLESIFKCSLVLKFKDRLVIDIENIDHTGINRGSKVLERAITDFYFISKCQLVFQIYVRGMHKSDFSKYGAYLGGVPFRIVELER